MCNEFIVEKSLAVAEIAAVLPRADKDLPVLLYPKYALENTPATLTQPNIEVGPSKLPIILLFADITSTVPHKLVTVGV